MYVNTVARKQKYTAWILALPSEIYMQYCCCMKMDD